MPPAIEKKTGGKEPCRKAGICGKSKDDRHKESGTILITQSGLTANTRKSPEMPASQTASSFGEIREDHIAELVAPFCKEFSHTRPVCLVSYTHVLQLIRHRGCLAFLSPVPGQRDA